MLLFFTAVRIVFLGHTLKELEEGHAVLTRCALSLCENQIPPNTNTDLIILGNQRADLPRKRPDGTIGLWGMLDALLRAQLLPKYQHGMRQAWHHPIKSLPKVQEALYKRMLRAITNEDLVRASEYMGQALHTLQDTYTIGHTDRENNADPFSPMLRLNYSPSKQHPFISPNDTVWTDETQTQLTPPAQAAIQATVAALQLWSSLWPSSNEKGGIPTANFVETYTPIRGLKFEAIF